MPNRFALFLIGCTLLRAEDARDIVRKAIEHDCSNYDRATNYSYQQRVEERKLDEGGKVRSVESKTYLTSLLAGEHYNQLIQRNDQPLTAAELVREQEKLAKEASERRKMPAYDKHRAKRQRFLKELPEAFNWVIAGQETLNGRPVYVMVGEPRQGYQPADNFAGRVMPKIRGKLWIDKQDYQWVKAEAEVIEPITFGLFLARLAPGAKVLADQVRINDEVWLPRTVDLKYDARVALVKHMNQEMVVTFKDYKRREDEAAILPKGRAKAAQN